MSLRAVNNLRALWVLAVLLAMFSSACGATAPTPTPAAKPTLTATAIPTATPPPTSEAIDVQRDLGSIITGQRYPRLANYYLAATGANRVPTLSRWDLLIIGMGNMVRVEHLWEIRNVNPDVLLLAYVSSHEVRKAPQNEIWMALYSGVQADWWVLEPGSVLAQGVNLQDTRIVVEDGRQFRRGDDVQAGAEQMVVLGVEGDTLTVDRGQYGSSPASHIAGTGIAAHVSKWPGTWVVNPDSPWSDYLADFMHERVMSAALWDGIHYDSVFQWIHWVNDGNIDLDRDGVKDDWRRLSEQWRRGMIRLFERTRANEGDKLIIGNGPALFYGAYLNGKLMESFPSSQGWLNNMTNYWLTLSGYEAPRAVVINRRSDSEHDFRSMRFGLASTLMGGGFYSFDYGPEDHSQTWWYDEYDVDLGFSISGPYQVGEIWRRDFEHGIVLVNPASSEVEVDLGGTYRKIQGSQDPAVNDGSLVSELIMPAEDGLILLRAE